MRYARSKFIVYLLGDRTYHHYGPSVNKYSRKQPTPLANNGEVADFLHGVQLPLDVQSRTAQCRR